MKKIIKTDAEWKAQLSSEEYYVARQKGTERPFTGRYWDHNEPGVYRCVGCGTALFASDTKFDAGCGWPSYFVAIDGDNVREETDSMACCALKYCAMSVTAIWATCFRMAHRQRVCATASTHFH